MAASLGAQALVAGVGKDLHARPPGQQPDQAYQNVVGDSVPQMDQRDQQSVDEDQLVFRPGTDRPPPGSCRENGLVPLMPQRAYLGDQFSDDIGRQARDPLASDDGRTRPNPHQANHDPRSWSRRATHDHA
ncbi:hypothetical protein ACFWVF_23685 [Streptomyces sp. NPDC058659]|uniref:hypothetical protein n=1 Tax=unclassified Streptomyces TaxID=2593676 RepID=UPI003669FB87